MAGINLANILQNVEQLKSAQQNREMNALRMQATQKLLGYADEDRAYQLQQRANADQDRQFQLSERDYALSQRKKAEEQQKQSNALRGKVASGDMNATRQFIALNPEEGAKIMDAFSKMDEKQKAMAQENIDNIGRMAAYVLQSEDPVSAYGTVLNNVSPEARKSMPEEFDRNYVTMQLARAREIEDLMKPQASPSVDVKAFGSEDVMFVNGKEVSRAPSNALLRANKEGGEGGSSGLKTADESLIFRQSAELMGGMFDQNGNLQNLDPTTRSKVQAIAAEAARLRQTGESATNSDAVVKAARKLKIDVQDLSGVPTGSTLKTFDPATGKFY